VRQLWRPVLERIQPYRSGPSLEALARDLGLPDLVRLSANESPLGPSPRVVEAIRREAPRAHLYPDGSSTALREALGRALGVGPDQVIAGNGADELLGLVAGAVLDPGDEVVIPEPSFEPYTTVSLLAGARIVASPLAKYEIDLADVLRRVGARTKVVFVCSPHNPATTIVRRGPLLAFLEALGPDPPLVVLDEAYCDFVDDPEYPNGIELLARYPRLVVLRTFSKIAGLAGLRVGYAVAGTDTIERLNRVRAPFNVNRLGQVAALAALEDGEHRRRTREVVLGERAFLGGELGRRGFAFPPSQANFLLVEVPQTARVRERLLHGGLVVRDGEDLGFPGHLRMALGMRATSERLLAILAAGGDAGA
jgi:histidinol-phosphate aminotransferase